MSSSECTHLGKPCSKNEEDGYFDSSNDRIDGKSQQDRRDRGARRRIGASGALCLCGASHEDGADEAGESHPVAAHGGQARGAKLYVRVKETGKWVVRGELDGCG